MSEVDDGLRCRCCDEPVQGTAFCCTCWDRATGMQTEETYRLERAAPKLLAACRGLLRVLESLASDHDDTSHSIRAGFHGESWGVGRQEIQAARTAIAEVEGKE